MFNTVLSFIVQNPMAFVLLAIVVIALILLWVVQRTKDNLDLRSLIVDEQTKQPSIHKLGQLTALVMSTWLLVYLALQNRMDSVYFTTYMGIWTAAQAINQWTTSRGRTDFSYGSNQIPANSNVGGVGMGGPQDNSVTPAGNPPQ